MNVIPIKRRDLGEIHVARDGRSFARVAGVWWQLTDHEGRPAMSGAVEPLETTVVAEDRWTPIQAELLVCLLELYRDPALTPVMTTDDEVFVVTPKGSVFAVKRGDTFRLFPRMRLPVDARPSLSGDPVLRHLAETCDSLDDVR